MAGLVIDAERPVTAATAAGLRRGGGARIRRRLWVLLAYVTLVAGAAVVLTPFAWMVSTSLKDNIGIFAFPPRWIPTEPRWSNYPDALTAVPFLTWARNTMVVTGLNVLGQLLSCTIVGYGFARLRFRGRNVLFIVLLATLLIPYQVTLIPQFLLYTKLGWVGTFLPLTVPPFFSVGGAFYIFLIRQYLMTIPYDLDEAARLDGASTWQILYQILLPLLAPPLTIVAVFTFTESYNDFLAPLIYLQDDAQYTLAVGLSTFVSQYGSQWNWLMASALVVLLPLLVIYYFAQRLLIGGIASVGLKG